VSACVSQICSVLSTTRKKWSLWPSSNFLFFSNSSCLMFIQKKEGKSRQSLPRVCVYIHNTLTERERERERERRTKRRKRRRKMTSRSAPDEDDSNAGLRNRKKKSSSSSFLKDRRNGLDSAANKRDEEKRKKERRDSDQMRRGPRGGGIPLIEQSTKYVFYSLFALLLAMVIPIVLRQLANKMVSSSSSMRNDKKSSSFFGAKTLLKKWSLIDSKSTDTKLLLGDMYRADMDTDEAIKTLREVTVKYDSALKQHEEEKKSGGSSDSLKMKSKEASVRLALALLDKADGNAAKSPLGFTHDKTPLVEAKYNLKKAKAIEEELKNRRREEGGEEDEEEDNNNSKNINKIEIEIALSRVYQHERDFPAAVAILNDALEKKPSSTEARWQLAVAHQGAGDCQSALEQYRVLIEDAKVKHAHVYLRASMCLLHGRKKEDNSTKPLKMHSISGKGVKTKVDPSPEEVVQAISYLEAATTIDSSLGHAWMQLGLAHVLRNAPREAIGPLERAKKELGENSLTADFHLAAAYQQANRCKDAIPLLMNVAQKSREQHERMMHIDNIKDGRAQKLESSIPAHEAFLRAGGCKFLMGEVDGAIELYREALVSSDKFAPALVNWGIALEHKKEYDKAEEKYKLAVEKNPKMAEAYARWGTLNFGQARTLVQAFVHKQREEKNKKKVWKNPEDSKERKELGALIDAAFSRLEKAAALDPTHSINQRLSFMRQQAKALIKEVEGKNSQMDEPWDLKEERENSQQQQQQ
jgi:tetratricopeptide (TPR) repeat protein